MSLSLPDFDNLPPVPGMPQGCAWGIFDKGVQKDIFGTLNLLTPDVVKAAAGEVRQGRSISLNWPIGSLKAPRFFRKTFIHKVMELQDMNGVHYGFDDEVEFNTQASSQWDRLCHFLHFYSGKTYNGAEPTVEKLANLSNRPLYEMHYAAHKLPTLNNWHARGCIAGRGVLIDFKAYADAKGITYSMFGGFRIGVSAIEAVAKYQGVTFQPGDILIIRFGVTEALGRMTGEQQAAALSSYAMCGLEGTVNMARWLWNQHFAAVASDNMAVEAYPPLTDGQPQPLSQLHLHEWCLSLFGMPLGELWYLGELSAMCQLTQKYTFFLTSSPLNVPGLVASPSNALAII